jgi:FSR family fosmidomycin resistance protein-like MFS transporter
MQRFPLQRAFWSVSLGHLTVDTFSGMGPVLLAFLSAHVLSLSNTQIGFAVSAAQLTSALSQPLFGWSCDRNGGRLLAAGGVAWMVFFLLLAMLLAQVTGSFAVMLLPYVIAFAGSAAFHPVGAMYAAESSRARAASNTSIFFLMGQLGLAIGPALAGVLLDQLASHNNDLFTRALGPVFAGALTERGTIAPVLALGVMAIPAVLFMALSIPDVRAHLSARAHAAASAGAAAARRTSLPMSSIVLLAVVVALRGVVNPGSAAFIPRLFQVKGWDATAYGFVTSAFWLGGGIAGVLVARLADKRDSRLLVALTLIATAPAMFLLVTLNGTAAFIMALAAGALSGASHSLIVVQAQALMPGRKGLASGAILGYMFSAGAVGSFLIGSLSDRFGLPSAFYVVAAVSVLAGVLGLFLPADRHQRVAAPAPDVEAVAAGD